MNIDLIENTVPIKECDKSKIKYLKEYIYQKIYSIANHIDFDISKINNIQIILLNNDNDSEFAGKTSPILKEDELFFDLIFIDNIISWVEDSENEKYDYALEVIMHELYHCKEMIITSQYIDYKKIYFYNQIDTTYDLVLNFAKKQFSEYYAFYYANQHLPLNTKCDFKKYIHDSSIYLRVLSNNAQKNHTVVMPESFWDKINSYIYACVKHIAKYHCTNNEDFIHIFDEYKDDSMYCLHYIHFLKLNSILKETLTSYPQKMSEEFLIEFGKKLLSIFNLYSLDFSTDDLSDNITLKYVGNDLTPNNNT